MVSSNSKVKVSLSVDKQTLYDDQSAILTFNFSSKPLNFDLDDIDVRNGVVTDLKYIGNNTYTATYMSGNAGMAAIKLAENFCSTPSNTVTIKNIDSPVPVVQPTVGFSTNNFSVKEGNDGYTELKFKLDLSQATTEDVTVSFTTGKKLFGTATADKDFVATTSSIKFEAGETTKYVTIKVLGDTTVEANESFYVDILSATNAKVVVNSAEGLRSNWAVGTIINDDILNTPTVGFSTNNMSFKEGNVANTVDFTIKLSSAATQEVVVDYTTNKKLFGTATADVDYSSATGSVKFAIGETQKTISVNINGDTSVESNETFYLDLTSAKGATLVKDGSEGLRSSWQCATITNDDISSTPVVGFSTNNFSVKEGNSGYTDLSFTLKLSSALDKDVTVSYTTNQKLFGSATNGDDYTGEVSTITFAPGETTKTIDITVIGDSVYEANETFYVDLLSSTNSTIVINGSNGLMNNWAVGTIINDDVVSTVTVTDDGIYGTTSMDIIGGTSHDDCIYGRGGSDVITGFSGEDLFVFSKNDSVKLLDDAAKITDFDGYFDNLGMVGMTQEDVHVQQGVGEYMDDTIVSTITGETLLVLLGVDAHSINPSEFVYML